MHDIQRVFDAAGARGFLHARDIDGDGEVALDADAPVALASVFKIAVLVELARQCDNGEIAWTDRVVVPSTPRTEGPTGLSVMLDDVELSVRDLAYWMMSVSDNAATDVLMARMGGVERINATLHDFGFAATRLMGDCQVLLGDVAAQLGIDLNVTRWTDLDADVLRSCPALQPEGTNRSTPRDTTALLAAIWRDEVASPDASAAMRRILALQVWPHRITSGFGDGVAIAAKTGTLPGIRNEAGVIQTPSGRYAVAVFTRSHEFAYRQPAIDAAIGAAARLAVEYLSA